MTTIAKAIPASELIEIVKAIALENPDYIYKPEHEGGVCSYYRGDCEPSTTGLNGCLIGQALSVWADMNSQKLPFLDGSVYSLFQIGLIIGSEEEKTWLTFVQSCQDIGKAWAICIEHANEQLEIYREAA